MKTTFAAILSLFLCLSASAETQETQFVKLALYPGYCGEVDPYIVGDACVFRAVNIKTKRTIAIYDNADAENSDLAKPSSEHKLVEGKNCFLAEIYQTPELAEAFGGNAFFSKILKRITCEN